MAKMYRLCHTDSNGAKHTVGVYNDVPQAVEGIIGHQKRFFVVSKKIKLAPGPGIGNFSFKNDKGEKLDYFLEEI